METVSIQLEPFFEWLLRTTLQAGLLICLILLVQTILRGRLGIRWHYCLWLLLLVRMVMPWSPQSRASLYNFIPESIPQRKIQYIQQDVNDESVSPDAASVPAAESIPVSTTNVVQESREPVTARPSVSPEANSRFKPGFLKLVNILPIVWLTGAILLAIYVCVGNFNLWRIVKRRRPLTDQKILDLLEDCKDQMGIRTILGIVPTDKVKSPALYGFIRPRLLLPQGMIEILSQEELRYVLLHELAHLKRHDIYIGWLMSLLQVLHWFNPLIWLAFYRMRADRELACDALVLARTQSGRAKDYGRIIVGLVERFSRARRLPAMAGILESKAQLKRRITMIAQFKKNSYQWSPLAVILMIILACVSLPNAISTRASETSIQPAPPIVLRRLWSGSDVDIEGAPSPDGRYLSYVDWETGDLAIYEIATGKKRRLTNKGSWNESGEFAQFSRWSPDGRQIVYDWYNKKDFVDLCIVGLDGSQPRILYSNEEVGWAQTYDWSPDGKHILACFSKKEKPNEIVLVSVSDGSVRVLKTLDKYPQNMSFSPDGRYIVYDAPQKEDSPGRDIYLLLTDGSCEMPLIEHPADDCVLGWAPDGKHVIFASNRTGTASAWLIAVADGKSHGDPQLVKPDIGRGLRPMGFTKDGSFYYGKTGRMVDIYVAELDPNTGKVLNSPKKAVELFEGSNRHPEYSPDGKYLAYVSTRSVTPLISAGPNVLCIRSLETGQERELSSKLRRIAQPRWSPDSKSILVGGEDYSRGGWGNYLIDSQTGTFTLILPAPKDDILRTHEWSADGKAFYIVRRSREDKLPRIMLRDIESGTEKELYRSSYPGLVCLSCSPDGKWLVFGKRDKAALIIMPAAGGEPREFYSSDQENKLLVTLSWTPDSKYILFVIREQDQNSLWRIAKEGGEPQKLGLEMEMVNLSVHPNGRYIAFNSTTGQPAEVWVMENFLPETPLAKPAGQIALRQVWAGSKADAYGTASSDGRYLSHTDWNNGDLAIRELATGKTRLLTETKKGGMENFRFALNSVISPDNKLITYSWTNQHGTYDLCVIGTDGSGDRTLYSSKDYELYPACWSSDGKRIAARRYGGGGRPDIVSVLVEDGSIQVLKTLDKTFWPQFCYSPNDKFFIYDFPVEGDSENYDISLIFTDGSDEIPLVKHPANDRLLGWVPNCDEVLFRSDRSGTHDIWAVRVVDGKVQDSPRPVTRDVGEISQQGFTRDGSFYFSRYKRRFTSQTIPFNAQTGEVQEQSAKPLLGSNYSPAWSPDGKYLAYVEEQTQSAGPGWYHRPLHIRDVKTGKERTLAEEFGLRSPRWSPDGRFLLVIGKKRKKGYNGGVYKVDVKDGRVIELVQFPPVEKWSRDIWTRSVAEWAHDGQAIFYTSRGRIIRRELESGQEKQLYHSDGLTRALDVSPDGNTLVFGNEFSGEVYGQVMSTSVSGGEPTELCRFQESKGGLRVPRQLVWSPVGDYILFARSEEKGSSVCRVSSGGGELEVIWVSKDRVTDLSFHPNGDEIAVSTYTQDHSIWVMENFLPEVAASAGN